MPERYDIAIIGSGPAGLSAAINAKARNKSFLLFGSKDFSSKLSKAHEINNYLGLYGMSGEEMAQAFRWHLTAMEIEVTEERINNIYAMGEYYALQSKDHMYEATTIILAAGISFGKPLAGEKEFLGKGVSYCATCDAMFYKGKKAAVIGYSKRDEEEADFLAQVADKVYYIPMYKEEVQVDDKIEVISDSVVEIKGKSMVESLLLKQQEIAVDGVFILRESVAADQLVPGLLMDKNHVAVDKNMATNLPGCFAAGDLTGTPYQYIKSAGEGNVAALSAVSYIDQKNRSKRER